MTVKGTLRHRQHSTPKYPDRKNHECADTRIKPMTCMLRRCPNNLTIIETDVLTDNVAVLESINVV